MKHLYFDRNVAEALVLQNDQIKLTFNGIRVNPGLFILLLFFSSTIPPIIPESLKPQNYTQTRILFLWTPV